MKDFTKIAQLMKSDWNRRVAHDYRFWMSDGYKDDSTMWESGDRDFEIITKGIEGQAGRTVLEIGCGVGRLLRPAISKFKKVIGLDVSEKAIQKAKEFLGTNSNLDLYVGNGYDLEPIAAKSVDVAVSYAALTSIPTEVIANYLREMHRVLRPGGLVRLQCYLGSSQLVKRTDTLHLRCYEREHFQTAVQAAGFEIETIEELVLPIQVSFKEIGIEAVIVSLRKVEREPAPAEMLAQLLLPTGELEEGAETPGEELEYWMAFNYAKSLADNGDVDRAREALEYAVVCAKTVTTDVKDLLTRIESISGAAQKPAYAPSQGYEAEVISSTSDFYEPNLVVLKEKFPQIYYKVLAADAAAVSAVEAKTTPDGPSLYLNGQCLDHAEKPVAGADVWVKRTLQEKRLQEAQQIVVYGFSGGYHLQSFISVLGKRKLSCVEPSLPVFCKALKVRDLRPVLQALTNLSIGDDVMPEFFDEDSEFVTRPQTQAAWPKYFSEVRSKFYGTRGIKTLHPKIGVVGPIQGGTLPITGYTSRSLAEMRQRVRVLDMSGYAGGFHLVEDFVQDDVRRAIQRNNYVEMLSQLLYEAFTEKPIDLLILMAQAPVSARILQELKRQGVVTVLWFTEDYLRFNYVQQLAPFYDFVFTIQKGECIDRIKAAGAGEVRYLPMAADPLIHRPLELSAEEKARWGSPVSFVGAGYHNRQQVFASLANLPFKIWGTEWPVCKPFDRLVQEKARRLTPEEYVKIFNSTDININLHSSSERDGVDPSGDFVNPRTFELAACGAFQLVDERSHLPELFTPGKDIITFRNTEDLKTKIQYFLDRPEERKAIAQKGRERVLRDHTYDQRIREMLSVIYSAKFEHLSGRSGRSTWKRMLDRSEPHKELKQRCDTAFQRGEEPILDALVSDIVAGKGKLTETEQKLLFLHHVRKQIIRMTKEEAGMNK